MPGIDGNHERVIEVPLRDHTENFHIGNLHVFQVYRSCKVAPCTLFNFRINLQQDKGFSDPWEDLEVPVRRLRV